MTGFGIRNEYPAHDQIVFVPNEVPELLAFHLDIHLGLGEKATFNFGLVGLKLVQRAVENVKVIDDSVPVA